MALRGTFVPRHAASCTVACRHPDDKIFEEFLIVGMYVIKNNMSSSSRLAVNTVLGKPRSEPCVPARHPCHLLCNDDLLAKIKQLEEANIDLVNENNKQKRSENLLSKDLLREKRKGAEKEEKANQDSEMQKREMDDLHVVVEEQAEELRLLHQLLQQNQQTLLQRALPVHACPPPTREQKVTGCCPPLSINAADTRHILTGGRH